MELNFQSANNQLGHLLKCRSLNCGKGRRKMRRTISCCIWVPQPLWKDRPSRCIYWACSDTGHPGRLGALSRKKLDQQPAPPENFSAKADQVSFLLQYSWDRQSEWKAKLREKRGAFLALGWPRHFELCGPTPGDRNCSKIRKFGGRGWRA